MYQRIKILKKKLNKFEIKKLGQVIKDEYVKTHKALPEKTGLHNLSGKATDKGKFVAVYPDDFTMSMDVLILAHCKKYERFKKHKVSRPFKKPKAGS